MKQKNKTLKIILSLLIVVLISLISFGGIFIKDKNRMKNVLPEYQLGMDFSDARVFNIKPDDTVNTVYYDNDGNEVESSSIEEDKKSEYTTKDIPVNSEEILTKENFDKTKSIIEKRLQLLNVKEYEIREDSGNGEMYISIPENEYTDSVISQMTVTGDFKITDSEDESNVLLTGEQIKDVKVGIGTQTTGNVVFINIQFDKEGTKKLQEVSKIYTGEETTENVTETSDDNSGELADTTSSSSKKQVKLILDGETLLTTYFSEEVTDGLLQLTVGGSSYTSSEEDLKDSLTQASNLAVLLKTENLPITYKLDSNLNIKSDINADMINIFIIAGIIILAILIAYTIVRYKKSGILSMISLIGYVGLLLITIRYTNVVLSLTGFAAIALSTIMSYVFIIKVLKEAQKQEKAFKKVAVQFFTIYMPCLIISIIFSFSKYLPIASFGMVIFYSIVLMIIYHAIITRSLIDNSENK